MAVTHEQHNWYDDPLYYDIIFDRFTSDEVDFIEAMYDTYRTRGKRRILEPGCGSGRLMVPLAARGYRVAGFDLSKPMLEFARRRLAAADVSGTLKHAPMQSFRMRGIFDLAHCFVSTFKYLLTEADAQGHLSCIADALTPGGVYLLGFHLTEYQDVRADRERWTGSRDGTRVVCNISSSPPNRRTRTEAMRSRLAVTRGRTTRRFETTWQFRTYSAQQFRNLLAKVPALELVATYDFDYDASTPVELGQGRLDTVAVLRRR